MKEPIVKTYTPHASAIPFHNDKASTVKALCGPVGSGKTSAACMEFFLLCHESTVPVRGLVCRESYRQLHDSTLVTLKEWFGDAAVYTKSSESLRLTIPNTQGTILTHSLDFRHARRAEETSNLLSTEYGFIWLEEPVPAFQMEMGIIGGGLPKALFDTALMRLRQAGLKRRFVILTFNPPSKFHWVHKEFFKPSAATLEARRYALYRQPAYENQSHLPPNYYQLLLDRLDPELARRFVMGEAVTLYPGVRVYRNCHEGVHTVQGLKADPRLPLVLGFDFGRTPVVIISQILPTGQVLVLAELQLWKDGVEELAQQLTRKLADDFPGCKVGRSWGDPSGAYGQQTDERTCFSILAANKFPVQPGAIDFQARFESVDQRLQRMVDGGPAILIDSEHAPTLAEGMLGGYRYPRAPDGQVGHRPLKNDFSHSCNGLEYLCSGEFSILTGEALNRAAKPAARPQFNPLSTDTHADGGLTWMGR